MKNYLPLIGYALAALLATPAFSAPAAGGASATTGAAVAPGASLSHQQVMDAQRALSANGLNVTQDGIAGAQTSAAVRRFQAQQGLPQTGDLDSQTLRALNSATQSVPPTGKATDTPSAL